MPLQHPQLEKTLGLVPAVGLAINLVVGSGLLILPGLAYQQAGGAAVYAWAISALVSIPLLVVFARLGADIPGAGGVAGFMQSVFRGARGPRPRSCCWVQCRAVPASPSPAGNISEPFLAGTRPPRSAAPF